VDISMSGYLYAVAALVFVLALIGMMAALLRKIGVGFSPALKKGDKRRLAVIETKNLDPKHRLVLFRRDGAEHLIMLGGESGLLIETGIIPPAESSDVILESTVKQNRSNLTLAAISGAVIAAVLTVMTAAPAAAQSFTVDMAGAGGSSAGRIFQLVILMTVLTLAPSILVMVTSFTRIVIVLSFVRTAIGTQQSPPNQVLVSLALFLTIFIMMPTFDTIYTQAVQPLINEEIDEIEAYNRGIAPIRDFMLQHVREQDLILFSEIAKIPLTQVQALTQAQTRVQAKTKTQAQPRTQGQTLPPPPQAAPQTPPLTKEQAQTQAQLMPMRVLIPAFMISEIRRAFEIGFIVFIPFLVIDMVVSSVLMSMGMMMLPPVMIAMPFKIIFFVLVDGWYMIVGSLVRSFTG